MYLDTHMCNFKFNEKDKKKVNSRMALFKYSVYCAVEKKEKKIVLYN